MKRNLLNDIKNDLWVVVMDIIAVNAAYVLALLLRYYVHSEFKSSALKFVSVYIRFAPFYTVICIAVFALFRLYNGIWRYAGIADMNRIIGANVVTALLNFIGTTVFFERLPNSYYLVGAALQYLFVVFIRFSYRFLRFKRKGIIESVNPSLPVIVVGNNLSNNLLGYFLEENMLFRPIAYVDGSLQAKSINGIPVMATLEEAMNRQVVNNVVVVDPLMSDREKEALRISCENRGIVLHDYSWILMRQFRKVMLTDITGIIDGPCKLCAGDRTFNGVQEALEALDGRYSVSSIGGSNLRIDIQKMVVHPIEARNASGGKRE